MYADLFKGSINLSVRFGGFFRGFGGSVSVRFLGFLLAIFGRTFTKRESPGTGVARRQRVSPFPGAVLPLPFSREEPCRTNPFFSEQILSSAALF